jgi:DNA-binding XRE family transcriptional regulator
MSQQELADRVKIDSAHLSKIIHGKKQCLSLPTAIKIAQVLNTPVEEVFVLEQEKKKKK